MSQPDLRPPVSLSLRAPTSAPTTASTTDAEDDDAIRAELRAQHAATRRQHTSIPPALRDLHFEDLDSSGGRGELILALQAWSVQGGGIYLYGDVGGGKTRMAATAAWAMLAHRPVSWVPAPAAARAMSADFDDPDRNLLHELTRRTALVLDDLGHEKPNEATRALWHAAIDSRISGGLPLLVTSNFLPSEHGARHGAWLTSRLTGYCRGFRVLGRDRRLDP